MKPIPIGNDLNVSWAINRMGEGVPLSAYKLDLYMECGYAKMPVTEYTVDGNTVKFPFWGKDQKKTGVYKLVAVGNGGEKGMFTATCCGAFQLSSGCEVSCQSDLQVPAEVSCQSDLQVPANGLSAYQVWLSNGHQGTEGDFLTWLQQPAQSAAAEAGKATEAANTAAGKADTAATKATEAAETATKATEELQGAAGEATDAANAANSAADAASKATLLTIEAAKQADAATDAAEEAAANADKAVEAANTATKSATDAAQAADTIAKEVAANNEQWEQAEQARETAETKRQTDTQQAITDANTARDAANTAAGKAETAATEASTAAEKANEAAEGIDEKLATKQDTLESGVNVKTINGMTVLGGGNMVLMPCIQHYTWNTSVATTRKQVPAELRAKGIKISYNDNSGVYHVEQYQSDDISDEAWASDANWKGCRTPMTPLFEMLGATFNDETGYYEMHGYTDIDEREMMRTYVDNNCRNGSYPFKGTCTRGISRTNIPWGQNQNSPYPELVCDDQFCTRNGHIETLVLGAICGISSTQNSILSQNPKLKYVYRRWAETGKHDEVYGDVTLAGRTSGVINAFAQCPLIEEFALCNLRVNLNMAKHSPNVNLYSVNFVVQKAQNTAAITITVHPDVYAKLTDPSNTEWYAVNTAAQAKNIAFATTE